MAIDLSVLNPLYEQNGRSNYQSDIPGMLSLGSAIKSKSQYNDMKNLIQSNIDPATGEVDTDAVYKKLMAKGDIANAAKIFNEGLARKQELGRQDLSKTLQAGQGGSPATPGIAGVEPAPPQGLDLLNPNPPAPSNVEDTSPVPATPAVAPKPFTDDQSLDMAFYKNQLSPKEYFAAKKELAIAKKDEAAAARGPKVTLNDQKATIINENFGKILGDPSNPESIGAKADKLYNTGTVDKKGNPIPATTDSKRVALDLVTRAIAQSDNTDYEKSVLDAEAKRRYAVPLAGTSEKEGTKYNADQMSAKNTELRAQTKGAVDLQNKAANDKRVWDENYGTIKEYKDRLDSGNPITQTDLLAAKENFAYLITGKTPTDNDMKEINSGIYNGAWTKLSKYQNIFRGTAPDQVIRDIYATGTTDYQNKIKGAKKTYNLAKAQRNAANNAIEPEFRQDFSELDKASDAFFDNKDENADAQEKPSKTPKIGDTHTNSHGVTSVYTAQGWKAK